METIIYEVTYREVGEKYCKRRFFSDKNKALDFIQKFEVAGIMEHKLY